MEGLAWDYALWTSSRALEAFFLLKAKQLNLQEKKAKHETRNIIERFIISMMNFPEERFPHDQLSKEVQKNLGFKLNMEDVDRIFCSSPIKSSEFPIWDGRKLTYRNFSLEIDPEEWQYFFDILGLFETAGLYIRYHSLFLQGQQWSVSEEVFQSLQIPKDSRKQVEAFSSPFNSYFLRNNIPGKVFTMFSSDSMLGFSHNFFEYFPREPVVVFVNPPFIEEFLLRAVNHCNTLCSTPGTNIYFYAPNWSDSPFYTLLKKSPFFKKLLILNKKTFPIVTQGGKIDSPVEIVIAILIS